MYVPTYVDVRAQLLNYALNNCHAAMYIYKIL